MGAQNGGKMAPLDSGCVFGDVPHNRTPRHHHPYIPPECAYHRCRCGSRQWLVKTGGPVPTLVVCARCSKENKPATAYERGREAGKREVVVHDSAASF